MPPPESTSGPNLIPGVSYKDPRAGIAWLEAVLGFRTEAVHETQTGGVAFAQLAWRNGMIFVSAHATHEPWIKVGKSSICLVLETAQDVEAHYRRAMAAGATFIRPLHVATSPAFPDGVSQFDLQDPEGHFWTLSNYQPR